MTVKTHPFTPARDFMAITNEMTAAIDRSQPQDAVSAPPARPDREPTRDPHT